MCLSPVTLKDRTQVACRNCSLCNQNKTNDWIGRCLAEQATSVETVAVTLTYKGDGPESALLRYSDPQLFLKRLRKDFRVRYIIAGEYGTKKGRAHWHMILFFKGKAPPIKFGSNVDWEYWPHGHVFFQNPDAGGFAYMLKYIQKDMVPGSVRSFSMSKKPPLGHDFFCYDLAKSIVNAGLPLHTPSYSFAHVKNSKGAHRQYWLMGRMRELFMEQYCGLWWLKYRSEPPPSEYLLERWLDPIAKREMSLDPLLMERDMALKRTAYDEKNERERKAYLQQKRLPLSFLSLGSGQIAVAYSDCTVELLLKDEMPWLVSKDASASVTAQVARLPLSSSLKSELIQWFDATLTGKFPGS